jgi:hypothetical protein
LGFSVQQRSAALAFLAAFVSLVFLIADGYHGWLYGEASKHARAIERLMSSYYDTLSRFKDDSEAVVRFHGRLRAHRHGLFLGFQTQFGLNRLWQARPFLVYRVLYPFLFIVAVAAGTLVASGVIGRQSPPPPTRVIIEQVR